MELVTPGFGLIFWTTITFLILVFLLGKFAWKPILKTVNERDQKIEESLKAAEAAREQMKDLQSDHEKLVREAKAERDNILKEAKETRDKVIAEAQNTAKAEAAAILAKANEDIKREQEQAFKELKKEVVDIAIQAATVILKSELKDSGKQQELVDSYLKDSKFN